MVTMAESPGAPLVSLMGPDGEWLVDESRRSAIESARQDRTLRACVACVNVYRGESTCPACGDPGEPLEVCGYADQS